VRQPSKRVVSYLYLGSAGAANLLSNLDDLSITGIVNCTNDHEVPNHYGGKIEYIRIAIYDEDQAQILPYLAGAVVFIHRHICGGGAVLVHCKRGASRSATVVIAYLMAYRSLSRDEAFCQVKRRRRLVSPNEGFWDQLNEFEKDLAKTQDLAQLEMPPPTEESVNDAKFD